MTDRVALWVGAVILAVFLIDALAFGGGLPVLILQYLAKLIDWLEFWR
ncbi:hypothetical protein V8J36_13275 [Frigidibacter sp. MR17.14]